MRFLGVVALVVLGGWGLAAPAARAAEHDFGGLPKGEGQEETYYVCSACHSIRMVTQQRLTRDDWDDALVYMVEEQGMHELDRAERDRILDYLGKYLGRDVPR